MATLEVTAAPTPAPAVSTGKLEIVANRKELLAELDAVMGVVERKTTIPILANLLLLADPSGTIAISATDLTQSITTSFHAEVHEGGAVTIPARKFYEYVKLLAKEQVVIRQQDNNWIHVKCGASRTKMVGLSPEMFPKIPRATGWASAFMAADLRELVQKSFLCAPVSDGKFACGALLEIEGSTISMASTDGNRLAHVARSLDSVADPRSVFIPLEAMTELLSLLKSYEGQAVTLAEDDTTIYFGVGVRTLSSRKLAVNFPRYKSVIPTPNAPGLMLDVPTVHEALNRILVFSEHDTRCVRLALTENMLTAYSAAANLGESREDIDILGGPKEKLGIGFNGDYLRDFFASIEGNVEVHLTDSRSAALFTWRTDEGITFRYVVMPMRGNK